MDILSMTKQDFDNVPNLNVHDNWNKFAKNGRIEFESFIIIPVEDEDGEVELHESGFGCMKFCLVDNVDNKSCPIGIIGGGTDVVHLDGIGGYGIDWLEKYNKVPSLVPPHSWTMDLLPCGYLNIWTGKKLFITRDILLSTLEVFSEDIRKICLNKVSTRWASRTYL